ncbi:MAG TPA: hypothetical protein ACHBX0_02595 [Arsenophonus sp.]
MEMVCATLVKLLSKEAMPKLMLGALMVEQSGVTINETIGESVVLPT